MKVEISTASTGAGSLTTSPAKGLPANGTVQTSSAASVNTAVVHDCGPFHICGQVLEYMLLGGLGASCIGWVYRRFFVVGHAHKI